MQDLIQIHQVMFGEEKVNATDSRELYKKLGLRVDNYSHWIKRYMNEYNFEEGFDYVEVVLDNEVNPLARAKNTIIISTDMAKEICMMTNNEIGSKIRKYYIALERKQCDTSKSQLETAHQEIKQLQCRNMKSYKDGFMALKKYLKKNNINMTQETAWDMLVKYKVVEKRDVLMQKKFLIDETFGRQKGDSVIEFNSRSLDLIFSDYIDFSPTLF